MKIWKQSLNTNDRIPSNQIHFKGLRHIMALLNSAAEIGAVGNKSKVTVSEVVMDRQDVLKTNLK